MTAHADENGVDILTLHINIDGLSLFKSSPKQAWVILDSSLNCFVWVKKPCEIGGHTMKEAI